MYESHVGKHLEQLSLFVLPQIDGDEIEQEEGTVLPQVSGDESEQQIEQDHGAEDDQHGSMNPPCGLVHGCQRPRLRFQDGRQAFHCDLHIPCAKSGPLEGGRQMAAPHSDFCFAHKCSLEGCADGKESSSSSHYCKQHTCLSSGCHQAKFNIHSQSAKYCSNVASEVSHRREQGEVEDEIHDLESRDRERRRLLADNVEERRLVEEEARYAEQVKQAKAELERKRPAEHLAKVEEERRRHEAETRLEEEVVARLTAEEARRGKLLSGYGSVSDSEPDGFRPRHAGPSNTANTADALLIDGRVREINDIKDDPDGDRAHSTHGIDGGHEGSHSRRGGSNPYTTVERLRKAMLSKALARANVAVELDNAQNFQGARSAYREACDLLHQVLLRMTSDEDKKKLEAIRKTCIGRVEELDQMLPDDEQDIKEDRGAQYAEDAERWELRKSKSELEDLRIKQEKDAQRVEDESRLNDESLPEPSPKREFGLFLEPWTSRTRADDPHMTDYDREAERERLEREIHDLEMSDL
ncbi:hypothetical protein INS49_008643 [Diaporthe citri]|uniref:uncharacterized protein n=1 Tax=Diaporthe citri TaxID=83186 RepID=UPI001C7F00F9|nr:uncharacterized protein INS49_008643 [Diaporthe citri]KAG6363542.1 hypothetical protein INS49_008643 [Diaporthe citri]